MESYIGLDVYLLDLELHLRWDVAFPRTAESDAVGHRL
jgi:hypothetical protein